MTEPIRLRGFLFTAGSPPVPIASWETLEGIGAGKGFAWIDAEGALDSETEAWLRDRLEWHPIVLQNIRQANSRARLTPFEDYTHLVLFAPPPGPEGGEADETRTGEIDAVIGPGYLVTFHREPVSLLSRLLEELPGWKNPPKSPDLLLHRMVFSAVEAAAPQVDALDDALAALEEEALSDPSPDLLERIVAVRDALFLQHLSLAPQLQMLHDLTSGASRFITPYARPFFRSTENRLRGLIDDIAIYREVVQNTLELYRSAMTHKTNETIRLLTVVSTPLLVLAFLTGLYGMNVPLPFAESRWAFAGLLGVSGAIFLGMLAWFRRRQWF